MIISTTNLNNIKNKITTSRIEGIEFIIGTDTNDGIELNASYNDIKNILNIGKLPVIKYNNTYIFVSSLEENVNYYNLIPVNSSYSFGAEGITTNLLGGELA